MASGEGCVMTVVAVDVQPFESVTVTVYVPADKEETDAVEAPPGAHKYE